MSTPDKTPPTKPELSEAEQAHADQVAKAAAEEVVRVEAEKAAADKAAAERVAAERIEKDRRAAIVAYKVRSARRASFRRCGFDFDNKTSQTVAVKDLTREQCDLLEMSDPKSELVVEPVYRTGYRPPEKKK